VAWFIVVCTAIAMFIPTRTSIAADEHKTVLILHSFGQNSKPWSEYSKALRQELERRSPWPVIIEEVSVITARADEQNAETQFVGYLHALFDHRPPDLIVTFGALGGAFVQRHRSELFPAIPMILTTIEARRVQSLTLTENDTVVAVRQKIPVLFGNILQLLPNTKTIAVVTGNSERFWIGEIKRELESLKDRVTLRFYNDLSFDQILKEAASLPPDSAIYWNQTRIARGEVHEGQRALTELAAVANAPIFTFDDSFFTGEIVGGPMASVLAGTKATTDVVLRVLAGEKPSDIQTPPLEYGPAKYDWRQLQRWGIGESRLPPGSEIYFREPTLWDNYRWYIALLVAVLLAQVGLIIVLVSERRRRLYFEVQASRRSAELAHSNRYSMAGELTASIAHEINQPLGSILTNAETAQAIIKSQSSDIAELPDIIELKDIVNDILQDDRRATEVIRRMRSLLKKAPFELRQFDLNEVVQQTIRFFSALAVGRKFEMVPVIAPDALPILGDQVQLQQVILNFVMNGIEAMMDTPSENRIISIRTSRVENFAELSVSDRGPGIPEDKLKEVFEPFFTSKAEGMGMGLSIARTIIEAHHGLIWARNRDHGGASFRIKLPLSMEAIDTKQAVATGIT
jgi:signal transduction histidine kinase